MKDVTIHGALSIIERLLVFTSADRDWRTITNHAASLWTERTTWGMCWTFDWSITERCARHKHLIGFTFQARDCRIYNSILPNCFLRYFWWSLCASFMKIDPLKQVFVDQLSISNLKVRSLWTKPYQQSEAWARFMALRATRIECTIMNQRNTRCCCCLMIRNAKAYFKMWNKLLNDSLFFLFFFMFIVF